MISEDRDNKSKPFIIPLFIPHAGCPHQCAFCDQSSTTGEVAGIPSAEQLHIAIRRFLRYRRDPGRYTEISFYGGNFLGLGTDTIQSMLSLADAYVGNGAVHGIRFSTRPDTIDDHRIALIRDYSVKTIELGAQSMDDRLLEKSRRGHTAEETRQAVKRLRQHPYRLGLQLMVGLPGESDRASRASAEQIAALAPDFVRIYPTLVLRGSPMERWYRQGGFTPLVLDEAVVRAKRLYLVFYRHRIPVVRMGLQPTEELSRGAGVVAGPFHPAFGELVHAAIWRDVLEKAVPPADMAGQTPVVRLHPKLLSRVKGNKNENVEHIRKLRNLSGIEFRTSDKLPMDMILVAGRTYGLADI